MKIIVTNGEYYVKSLVKNKWVNYYCINNKKAIAQERKDEYDEQKNDFKKTIQNNTYCRCNVIDSISIWRMWKQYLRLNLNFISDSRDIIFIRAGCKY